MPISQISSPCGALAPRDALRELLAERAVRHGPVTLASGDTSDFYIDCKQVTLSAAGARLTGGLVFEHIQLLRAQGVRIDGVGGMTLGADPIAVAASLVSAQAGQPVDSFVIRKQVKAHGSQSQVEKTCACVTGAHVLILEDVVTSGASTLKAIEAAQRAGLVPIGILALVDREEGGRAALAATQIPFCSILSRRDFIAEAASGVSHVAPAASAAIDDARREHSASRLIVALDLPDGAQALQLARALRPYVSMVKLGLESFVAQGPALVRQMRAEGIDVFLDLKLHDTPRTVAAAVHQACALNVQLLTVHAAGGEAMIRAAVKANTSAMKIIAVTILTSFDDAALSAVGLGESCTHAAFRLGALAMQAGADGLVCSAAELDVLRPLGGLRIVPGIRHSGAQPDDQARAHTPAHAAQRGADWLVVGRPITQSAQPLEAMHAFNAAIGCDNSTPVGP